MVVVVVVVVVVPCCSCFLFCFFVAARESDFEVWSPATYRLITAAELCFCVQGLTSGKTNAVWFSSGAVRCGAVRCSAVRCSAVRCGAVLQFRPEVKRNISWLRRLEIRVSVYGGGGERTNLRQTVAARGQEYS